MKNIFFMGSSTVIRLVFGLFVFSVLARFLGPEMFGFFMFWLSVTSLVGIVANYGFTPYILREIGAKPESANHVMGEVLSAKLLVAVLLLIVSICVLPFLDNQARWVFLFLILSMLADSTSDFLNVGYRATNRFGTETKVATIGSICQFLIVVLSVINKPTVVMAAFGFFLSRVSVLVLTWTSQSKYFSNLQPAPLAAAIFRLRQAKSYAIDFSLQSLFGQIDSLILNHYLGAVAVGLHQAGMRLVLGGSQASSVLGNVFIPKLAAVVSESEELQREGQRLQLAFILVGLVFGLVLAAGSEIIVKILFGQKFIALVQLLPWFGLLFFVRFLGSAFGVILTSCGRQALRAKANLIHWVLIFLSAFFLVPHYANIGWIISLTLGNIVLCTIYFLASYRLVHLTIINIITIVFGAALFIPFLHVN